MGDIGKPAPKSKSVSEQEGPVIPPLDQEQEYEWKWRVSLVYLLIRKRLLIEIAKDGGLETNFLFVIALHYITVYLFGLCSACIHMYRQHLSYLSHRFGSA